MGVLKKKLVNILLVLRILENSAYRYISRFVVKMELLTQIVVLHARRLINTKKGNARKL